MSDRQSLSTPSFDDDGLGDFTGEALGMFSMALHQTTGSVESLLRLVGLERMVPDVSTRFRPQKPLDVKIPYRGSMKPLHLPIRSHELGANHERAVDSTGIRFERVRNDPHANMVVPNGELAQYPPWDH